MNVRQLGFLLTLMLAWSISFAHDAQSLIELLNPIQSLQANFTQTILDNQGKAIQRSEGKVSLQRPGQFRWEVVSPIPQTIVANTTRMWIYDPDLQQVVIRPIVKTVGQTPPFLLTNISQELSKDFNVQAMPSPDGWKWFKLTPKDKSGMFENVQLGFLNRSLKEMRMRDSLGHSTVIEFKQVKENILLSKSVFDFKLPNDVDVIDETHKQ